MSFYYQLCALLALAQFSTGSPSFDCTPLAHGLVDAKFNLTGPSFAASALSPYVHRRCQYLMTPDEKYTLEVCLYRSLRFIDKENFSIFLGYFKKWSATGEAVHEYGNGQPHDCPLPYS